jgi:hypothetical protein
VPSEIPLALKMAWTAFVALLVPVYWRRYGPANFLWFSDLALFATAVALWLENALVASIAALAVALPELAWNADFGIGFLRRGRAPLGLAGYMFDRGLPRWLRGLSLFHVALPLVLVFLLHRLGYDERAWAVLTPVASAVLVITYLFTAPEENINWVFGPGTRPQRRLPPPFYLLVVMLFFPLVVYLPTHLALSAFFG